MTDVTYNLFSDAGTVVAKGHVVLLSPWAGIAANAESVASEICVVHLDDQTWAEFFFDSSHEVLIVEILSPAEVAGHFRVDVRMKPNATAKRIPDAEIVSLKKS